jgi:hypothetical protein
MKCIIEENFLAQSQVPALARVDDIKVIKVKRMDKNCTGLRPKADLTAFWRFSLND